MKNRKSAKSHEQLCLSSDNKKHNKPIFTPITNEITISAMIGANRFVKSNKGKLPQEGRRLASDRLNDIRKAVQPKVTNRAKG